MSPTVVSVQFLREFPGHNTEKGNARKGRQFALVEETLLRTREAKTAMIPQAEYTEGESCTKRELKVSAEDSPHDFS